MSEVLRPTIRPVVSPDGSQLTMANLPPPGTTRWVVRRKAEVVAAVRGGLLSFEEACSRYTLAAEELLSWQYWVEKHGPAGLHISRLQHYRQKTFAADAPTGGASKYLVSKLHQMAFAQSCNQPQPAILNPPSSTEDA